MIFLQVLFLVLFLFYLLLACSLLAIELISRIYYKIKYTRSFSEVHNEEE